MKILALEFSTAQRSVAVVTGSPGQLTVAEALETGGRAVKAIALIDSALRQAQIEREQIDCLAIATGPGSYNGIRAAIALAQGWELARDIKLLGISSVECLAAQAQTEGVFGRVNIIIDAQRNEYYLAVYEVSLEHRTVVEPLKLATLDQVKTAAASGTIIGPDLKPEVGVGKMIFPRAATLGQLALERRDYLPGERLEPIYLRETTFVKAAPPRIFPP